MRALSIRQPYAELILRGIKTIEYRTRPTRLLGERFWIYASKTPAAVWSSDLEAAHPPKWLLELARQVRLIDPQDALPTGVLVGSAVIDRVSQVDEHTFGWHLADIRREANPKHPARHPQPTWFNPF